jgi:integrase
MLKKAKFIDYDTLQKILDYVKTTRQPQRNKVMVLLSCKAGLRAMEIAGIIWPMLTDANGNISETIQLTNNICKKQSGREIPINKELRQALSDLQAISNPHNDHLIFSERGDAMTTGGVTCWFALLYKHLNLKGCSSHSGRLTFATTIARSIENAEGASLVDLQQMLGHKDIRTTSGYIAGDSKAKRRLVEMI